MKKFKLAPILLVLLMALSGTPTVYAQDTTTVNVNGTAYTLTTDITKDKNAYLMSQQDLMSILGLQEVKSSMSMRIEMKKGKNDQVFILYTNDEYNNNQKVKASAQPVSEGGKVRLPIKDVCDFFGATVQFDTKNNTVNITTAEKISADKKGNDAGQGTMVTVNPDKTAVDLTVDAALDKAIANSSALKTTQENIDASTDSRKPLVQSITTYANANDITVTSASNMGNLISLVKLDMGVKSMENSLDTTKETLQYSIERLFVGIQNSERAIALQTFKVQNAASKLEIAKKKVELGVLSQSDLSTIKLAYDTEVKTLNDDKITLANTYLSLTQILGDAPSTKYNVELDLSYKPLGNVNLDSHVVDCINNSPTLLSLKQNIDLAKYQQNIYTGNNDTSYSTKQAATSQAQRALEDAKKGIENSVRATYNTIQSSELTINQTQQQLDKMNGDLKVMEVQLNLGKLTAQDISEFKYNIAALELNLVALKQNHELNVIAFNKPYLASNN